MRQQVIEKIAEKKVIAIVRGIFDEDCVDLAKALYRGGVELLEATFDQESAEEREKTANTIRMLNKELGGKMCFGAGTVTSVEMVHKAKEAGAEFIISPNTDEAVINETVKLDMVSVPGALTPTEIKFAHDCGGDFIKVFPANLVGSGYFKAVKAPLSQCKLLAVGSVNGDNIKDYMAAGAAGAGVAGCLFKKEWVKAGEWDKITEATKTFMELLK